jgi:hypothetical protein
LNCPQVFNGWHPLTPRPFAALSVGRVALCRPALSCHATRGCTLSRFVRTQRCSRLTQRRSRSHPTTLLALESSVGRVACRRPALSFHATRCRATPHVVVLRHTLSHLFPTHRHHVPAHPWSHHTVQPLSCPLTVAFSQWTFAPSVVRVRAQCCLRSHQAFYTFSCHVTTLSCHVTTLSCHVSTLSCHALFFRPVFIAQKL